MLKKRKHLLHYSAQFSFVCLVQNFTLHIHVTLGVDAFQSIRKAGVHIGESSPVAASRREQSLFRHPSHSAHPAAHTAFL